MLIEFLTTVFVLSTVASLSDDDRAVAKFVLAGHTDSRERLRAGAVRGSGTRSFISRREGVDTDADVEIFCAFDYDNGLLRFERVEPAVNPKLKARWGGRFLRTPSCVAQCTGGSNIVDVSPRDTAPLGHISPFDVRGIGCLNLMQLENGSSFERAFGKGGFLSSDKLADVSRESEDIYRLGWDLAKGQARRTIWFGAHVGYSPVRLEDSAYGDLRRRRRPANVVEASWRREGDAFVPTALRLEQNLGTSNGDPHTSRVYSFQFAWESVNQPIPTEVFDPEKLGDDLPRTMFVFDNRLDNQPILIKRTDRADETAPVRQGANRWPYITLLAVFACLLLLARIAFKAYRRRRMST